MPNLQLPVIISGIASLKDNSIKVTMETRELPSEHAAKLFELRNREAWAILAPDAMDPETVDLPKEKPDPALGKKTQSQRIRNCLYIIWQQKGSQGSFDQYYQTQTERIIEQLKENMDA